MSNPLQKLTAYGQSIWLDDISRSLILSGELQTMIIEDGLRGLSFNPAIFEKYITCKHTYSESIFKLAKARKGAEYIYEALTIEDVQRAADFFYPVYERTKGLDGYVSLEVCPTLAYDTEGIIKEGRKLWKLLNRQNVMIKVAATEEGLPAIQQLTSEGINTHITLLFSLKRHESVIQAYLIGLEHRVKKGEPIDKVVSVASFFISWIDTLADTILEKMVKNNHPQAGLASKLYGRVGIACVKVAYQIFRKEFSCFRFNLLYNKGAHRQRLLWDSTDTKNPHSSQLKYAEALIGPQTINTMPRQTMLAYKNQGEPARCLTLTEAVIEARNTLHLLSKAGIDLAFLTRQLDQEAVQMFNKTYQNSLLLLEEKRKEALVKT